MPITVSPRQMRGKSAIPPRFYLLVALLSLFVSSCSHITPQEQDAPGEPPAELPPDAVPKIEARSPYGNPESYVVFGKRYYTLDSASDYEETGIASWYGRKFHGRRTSSGEPYDMYAMTAAHRSLPLPSYVRVTNLSNNRSVVLRVNDRGPFHEDRVIDLSYAAALKLDVVNHGTALVKVTAIDPLVDPVQSVSIPIQSAEAIDSTANMELFVQVGAFGSQVNAERLGLQLKMHEIQGVHILPSSETEQIDLYKVRIGPLPSIQYADQTTKKLEKIGLMEFQIVFEPRTAEQSAPDSL